MKMDLQSYVKVYTDVLTPEFCAGAVATLSNAAWEPHGFYNPQNNTSTTYPTDLSVLYAGDEVSNPIMQALFGVLPKYLTDAACTDWYSGWNGYSRVRFNRYLPGTEMQEHCDHIHSLFDGTRKGVPVLTMLGALNDGYTGGKLLMWGDSVLDIPVGAVAVFPSNFLYPHKVTPVESGVRNTFVSWAW